MLPRYARTCMLALVVCGLATAVHADDGYEDNDFPGTAVPLTLDGGGEFFASGLVVEPYDDDWYQVTVAGDVRLMVTLTFSPGDADADIDLDIQDTGGASQAKAESGNSNERAAAIVAAGTYRIRVYGWEGSTNTYDMHIEAEAADTSTVAIDLPDLLAVEVPTAAATSIAQAAQPLSGLLASATAGAYSVTAEPLPAGDFPLGESIVTWTAWDGGTIKGTRTEYVYVFPNGQTPLGVSHLPVSFGDSGYATAGNHAPNIIRTPDGVIHTAWYDHYASTDYRVMYRRGTQDQDTGVVTWEIAPTEISAGTSSSRALVGMAATDNAVHFTWSGDPSWTVYYRRLRRDAGPTWVFEDVQSTGMNGQKWDNGPDIAAFSDIEVTVMNPQVLRLSFCTDVTASTPTWTVEQPSLPSGVTSVKYPAIAVDHRGELHVVFTGEVRSDYWQLRYMHRERPPGGGWVESHDALSEFAEWSDPGQGNGAMLVDWMDVAVTDEGDVHVGWHGSTYTLEFGYDDTFSMRRPFAGDRDAGAWEQPLTLHRDQGENKFSWCPSFCIDTASDLTIPVIMYKALGAGEFDDYVDIDAACRIIRAGSFIDASRLDADGVVPLTSDAAWPLISWWPTANPDVHRHANGRAWMDVLYSARCTDDRKWSYIVYKRYELTDLLVPDQASGPVPGDTSLGVALTQTLSWDAANRADSYDVYFGTDQAAVTAAGTSSSAYRGNQLGTTYDPGTLSLWSDYWWRVDTINTNGNVTGDVWHFRTTDDGRVLFVDVDATGNANGSSWSDAFDDLSLALTAAVGGDTLCVAEGVYYPSSTDTRTDTFQLIADVTLLGGFAGDETSTTDRDVVSRVTTLSGDLGTLNNWDDNSHHVVTGAEGAVLDGFVVRFGNSSGAAVTDGAGLLCDGVSVTVRNCVFEMNEAWVTASNGGAIYSADATLTATSCVFFSNDADAGGAVCCSGTGGGSLVNCTFNLNLAMYGGAVTASAATVQLTNCILWDDIAGPAGDELSVVSSGTIVVTRSNVMDGIGAAAHNDGTGTITDGGGNIDADPLFADSGFGDLALTAASPCIDAADGDVAPLTDLAGAERHDDLGTTDTGTGAVMFADLGAFEFTSTSYRSISGTISGAVTSGVTVTLSGAATDIAATDGGGAYEFTGLVNGSYTVAPELVGYGFSPVDASVMVQGADRAAVDFIAAALPRYTVSGHVVGDEVAGVTVTAVGIVTETATTDADGFYLIADLLAGEYAVSSALTGYVFQPASTDITVAASDLAGVNFTCLTAVSPTPANLATVADARLDAAAPDTTLGVDATLEVQGDNSTTWPQASVLRFDLTSIPAGATVHEATLRVWCSAESATKGGAFSVFGANQAWTETIVTYNSTGSVAWLGGDVASGNGSLDATATDSLINHASVDGSGGANPYYTAGTFPAGDDWADAWIEWDVTGLAQDWVDGTRANHGMALVCQARVPNPDGHALFDRNYGYMHTTWDAREGANDPQLVLSYTPAVATHAVTATASAYGIIEPEGTLNVIDGDDLAFTITPDAGCEIVDVLVDGASAGAVTSYTFTAVSGAHTISVTFRDPTSADGDTGPGCASDGGCTGAAGCGLVWWMMVAGAALRISRRQHARRHHASAPRSARLLRECRRGAPSEQSALPDLGC